MGSSFFNCCTSIVACTISCNIFFSIFFFEPSREVPVGGLFFHFFGCFFFFWIFQFFLCQQKKGKMKRNGSKRDAGVTVGRDHQQLILRPKFAIMIKDESLIDEDYSKRGDHYDWVFKMSGGYSCHVFDKISNFLLIIIRIRLLIKTF